MNPLFQGAIDFNPAKYVSRGAKSEDLLIFKLWVQFRFCSVDPKLLEFDPKKIGTAVGSAKERFSSIGRSRENKTNWYIVAQLKAILKN